MREMRCLVFHQEAERVAGRWAESWAWVALETLKTGTAGGVLGRRRKPRKT